MKLIESRPSRLHCEICKETYNLPQNGLIKTFKELRCPLDDFELVQYSANNNGKVNTSLPLFAHLILSNLSRVFPCVLTVIIILHLKICVRMPVAMNALIRHVVTHWTTMESVLVTFAKKESLSWI